MSYPKSGSLESTTYLGFVRRRPCFWCAAPAPSQAHHWPPKGRGVVDDSKTVPVCVSCHARCHGIPVAASDHGERGEPIAPVEQGEAVDVVMRFFLATASDAELAQFFRDLERWRTARVYAVPA